MSYSVNTCSVGTDVNANNQFTAQGPAWDLGYTERKYLKVLINDVSHGLCQLQEIEEPD